LNYTTDKNVNGAKMLLSGKTPKYVIWWELVIFRMIKNKEVILE
jgi:hypothetical protein